MGRVKPPRPVLRPRVSARRWNFVGPSAARPSRVPAKNKGGRFWAAAAALRAFLARVRRPLWCQTPQAGVRKTEEFPERAGGGGSVSPHGPATGISSPASWTFLGFPPVPAVIFGGCSNFGFGLHHRAAVAAGAVKSFSLF